MLTFDIYTWVCFPKMNGRGFASDWVLWKQTSAYSTGHGHCSITHVFHVWKSAIRLKHSCKKINTKIYKKIQANFPNLCVQLYTHIVIICSVMWHWNDGSLLHVFCLQHFTFYFYLACCFELFLLEQSPFCILQINVRPKWAKKT